MIAIVRLLLAVFILVPSTLAPKVFAQEEIVYFQSHDRFAYDIELLQHLLDITTEDYGPAVAISLNENLTEQQGLRALTRNKVDIAFLPTSKRREANYLPIKQPLLQGMLGFRLLLTNTSANSKLSAIHNIQQLRNSVIAGFGLHWEDLRILYRNRMPVMTSSQYQELFAMLSTEQIDYLPRGLNEIELELKEQTKAYPNLMINQDIALYYKFPRYFFVNRTNLELAERLTMGFARAKHDGSFRAIFDKHFGSMEKHFKSKPRLLIELNNPFLPDDIPSMETDWWLPEAALTNSAGKESAHNGQ